MTGGTAKVLVTEGDLTIRRMMDSLHDHELLIRWRNSPHVRAWWDPDLPDLTLEAARSEYGPDTMDGAKTTACIVERAGMPVGFMQFYLWSSYADEADEMGIPFDASTWGVDIFIGDPGATGKGLGTRMMDLMCRYLESERGATAIALTTEVGNDAAIACYLKAGFSKVRQIRELDTREGERMLSWLMIRGAPPAPIR